MKIEHFEVRNEGLRRYVDFYYLLSTVGDHLNTTYFAFPSGNSPLGFLKNASAIRESERIDVKYSAHEKIEVALVGNFLKPLEITFEPGIAEFSVVFKPLGINYFVRPNLGKELSKTVSQVNYFDDLAPVAAKIIEGPGALDEFENKLLASFGSNKRLEALESMIANFQAAESHLTENRISTGSNISAKRLFRLFKRHLGVNPTQYRHLLRFRNALDLSLQNLKTRNLTEVGLEAGFYDQPHFIREFKKITNLAPREFLNRISLEANDKIVWQFFSEMSD
jgi:AraC-like DNA-binding protein